MRDPLIDLAPGPPVALDPAVLEARAGIVAAVGDLLLVSDDALDRPWRWRPSDPHEIELRYGAYRILERLEEAAGAIDRGRADGAGARIGPAVPALAVATEARWDLHGVLRPLSDADWDTDPGGGEWTVRQTVGHTINVQRSYGWSNAWYLDQRATDEAVHAPDGVLPRKPAEAEEAAGDPSEVVDRIDDIVDRNIVAYAGLNAADLLVLARWSDLPVTIDFRLGRYGSHIREHTVQVQKTLDAIGRRRSEVERLVLLVLAGFGRLEGRFVGRDGQTLDARFPDGSDSRGILAAAMTEIVETAGRVRAAASD
jgi:hypothetical protein